MFVAVDDAPAQSVLGRIREADGIIDAILVDLPAL
jgi:hypothetical protein